MAGFDLGSIFVRFKADSSELNKGVQGFKDITRQAEETNKKLDNFSKKATSAGKFMTTRFTLPIVAGFGLAVKHASDLNETINKVDVAFADQAESVKEWAKTSIPQMGLAKQSALDAAALFGDMSTAMGLTTGEAADMSKSLTQLGADLASFKNISFEQAQTALAGVFTGETESLKRLGVIMTEANLAQFALTKGIEKNISEMTQAEKVQLRYQYVMENTKNAHGDFARTADGTANQIRMTQERFKELSAEIGTKLLPVANKILEWVGKMFDKFQALSPETQNFILIAAGVVAALGPVLLIVGKLITAYKGLRLAMIAAKVAGGNFITGLGQIAGSMTGFRTGPLTALKNGFLQLRTTMGAGGAWHAAAKLGVVAAAIWAAGEIYKAFKAGSQARKAIDSMKAALSGLKGAITDANQTMKAAVADARISASQYQRYTESVRQGQADIERSRGEIMSFKNIVKDFIPGLATGGPVTSGRPYIVGEEGPELFMPSQSGRIIPNNKLGQAGQVTVNAYVSDKPSADYLVERIKRDYQLSKLGAAGRV